MDEVGEGGEGDGESESPPHILHWLHSKLRGEEVHVHVHMQTPVLFSWLTILSFFLGPTLSVTKCVYENC